MMSVTLIILRLDLNLGSSLRQERNIALLTNGWLLTESSRARRSVAARTVAANNHAIPRLVYRAHAVKSSTRR